MTACLIPGCASETGPWPPGCRRHWRELPESIKAALRRTAPYGHSPASLEYREAVAAAAAHFQDATASAPVSGAADYAMALARRMTGERDE